MIPIYSDSIQHFMDIGTGETANFANATALLTFTPTFDKNEYSPSYIERSVSPKFRRGGTYTIETSGDAMSDEPLHLWLMEHEHDDNVVVPIVRVKTYDGTATARSAERAVFSMNVSPLQLTANEPVKINATFDMSSSAWETGTWNESTKTFTAGTGSQG